MASLGSGGFTSTSAESFPTSLWYATAAEAPVEAPCLAGEISAEVAVIGGGITGCRAALALAEAGAQVVLLEGREIGWGGSGRNGGQVIPGLKYDPTELVAKYGDNRGTVIAQQVGEAADRVFELIEQHQIACSPKRHGWIQAAHAPQALPRVLQRARDWKNFGAPVEMLDAPALARRSGAVGYQGGWCDGRAGTLQPLAYTRGLARAARAAGATLYAGSPVKSLTREGDRWVVRSSAGVVRARSVILATNAYSDDLLAGLRRTILPVQSIQVATGPLPEGAAAEVLPGGECLSETRRLAFYFRRSPDGGVMFGGRGAIGDGQYQTMFSNLEKAMRRVLPGVGQQPVRYRWGGQVAITLDGLPHVHEPAPGLFVGLGYNGRGVAMATVMGGWLAARLHAGTEVPLPRSDIAPIGWHALRKPIVGAGIALAWAQDRMGRAA